MQIQVFDSLSLPEKQKYIWQHGVFSSSYDNGSDMCDVYELYSFYVAVYYKMNFERKGKIVSSIESNEFLTPLSK
jgi:hypothetical protein